MVYAGIFTYVITHSYSLLRWRNIVNMMILKEENNFKIHGLQVIHHYESDLNFLLGFKWKEPIHLVSEHNTIFCGQFGGRPGRNPTMITLLEELCLDYSQMTPTPFVNFDHDAKSCYDRILMLSPAWQPRDSESTDKLFLYTLRHSKMN